MIRLTVFLTAVFAAVASCVPVELDKRNTGHFQAYSGYTVARSNFTQWIHEQPAVSWYYLLQNIDYPEGQFKSAKPGVVVASPSTSEPDYFYQWTRDTAITFLSLIAEVEDHSFSNTTLAKVVEYYISNTYTLQRVSNPSGNFDSPNHDGLGEPKFNVDDTAYTASWGRPQNDGPALRAYAISRYLNAVAKHNNGKLLLAGQNGIPYSSASDIYWKIIKPDLQHVSTHWSTSGFDLWEENQGTHFFTALVQLKALSYGIPLSKTYNDPGFTSWLEKQKDALNSYINSSGFVNSGKKHIVESPQLSSRGGLDSATYIAALITHDIGDDDTYTPFNVDNSYVLNSLYYLLVDNKNRYKINGNYKAGAAVGRYPEDVYNGVGTSEGNPWQLATAYAGQTFYTLAYNSLKNKKNLVIEKLNYDLYNSFIADLSKIDSSYASKDSLTLTYGSDNYKNVIKSLLQFGDSFLKVLLDHIDDNGQLTEEINRYTGFQAGAVSLTWSSGSLLSANRARNKLIELL
uniref:glucan 1,4-alpha-glucosidase n=1 Tax=Saccharomycopsis fibuligera TaxID=4944 RepID=Q8TFE5_SACFI|nr:glucoamylase [synthetic construct]CAC83969.1 glucoamylase [Saccharomycopsis fibuligera]